MLFVLGCTDYALLCIESAVQYNIRQFWIGVGGSTLSEALSEKKIDLKFSLFSDFEICTIRFP